MYIVEKVLLSGILGYKNNSNREDVFSMHFICRATPQNYFHYSIIEAEYALKFLVSVEY